MYVSIHSMWHFTVDYVSIHILEPADEWLQLFPDLWITKFGVGNIVLETMGPTTNISCIYNVGDCSLRVSFGYSTIRAPTFEVTRKGMPHWQPVQPWILASMGVQQFEGGNWSKVRDCQCQKEEHNYCLSLLDYIYKLFGDVRVGQSSSTAQQQSVLVAQHLCHRVSGTR